VQKGVASPKSTFKIHHLQFQLQLHLHVEWQLVEKISEIFWQLQLLLMRRIEKVSVLSALLVT